MDPWGYILQLLSLGLRGGWGLGFRVPKPETLSPKFQGLTVLCWVYVWGSSEGPGVHTLHGLGFRV